MIRTRLAPSPTGMLHIGGLRTALFAYLLAKKHDGSFFLRIEDTDQKRYVEGAVENLVRTLHAYGVDPDEGVMMKNGEIVQEGDLGPYVQSERLEIYQKYAQQLLDAGYAYRCFCTPERLEVMRKSQMAQKKAPMYDRLCCGLSEEEQQEKMKQEIPYVLRMKVPRDRKIEIHDHIRGKVVFDCDTIDDQVILKSDGFPTYHLAHVVDDHLMQTKPVIRGEEWLPSLPKHILLFEMLGWDIPEFAHIPLLLNKNKSKLSKRDGDVAAEDYIKKGYLPEAVVNFVAFLGWNPGTEQEIFSMEELIEAFSLERVNKSGAVFDVEKLNWYNAEYIKKMSVEEVIEKIQPYMSEAGIDMSSFDQSYVHRVVPVAQERMKLFNEAPDLIAYFFRENEYNADLLCHEKMKVTPDVAKQALEEAVAVLKDHADFTAASIKEVLIQVIAKLGFKNGQVLWPMRAALSQQQFSPGAFEMAEILGKEKTLERIEKALNKLN